MTVKPTDKPDWTDAGVEPPVDKKAVGWTPGERPPANFFDWLLTTISSWITWLDAPDGVGVGWGERETLLPLDGPNWIDHTAGLEGDWQANTDAGLLMTITSTGRVRIPLPPLIVGQSIIEIGIYFADLPGANRPTFGLIKKPNTTPTTDTDVEIFATADTADAWQDFTLASPEAVGDTHSYFLEIDQVAVSSAVYNISGLKIKTSLAGS